MQPRVAEAALHHQLGRRPVRTLPRHPIEVLLVEAAQDRTRPRPYLLRILHERRQVVTKAARPLDLHSRTLLQFREPQPPREPALRPRLLAPAGVADDHILVPHHVPEEEPYGVHARPRPPLERRPVDSRDLFAHHLVQVVEGALEQRDRSHARQYSPPITRCRLRALGVADISRQRALIRGSGGWERSR